MHEAIFGALELLCISRINALRYYQHILLLCRIIKLFLCAYLGPDFSRLTRARGSFLTCLSGEWIHGHLTQLSVFLSYCAKMVCSVLGVPVMISVQRSAVPGHFVPEVLACSCSLLPSCTAHWQQLLWADREPQHQHELHASPVSTQQHSWCPEPRRAPPGGWRESRSWCLFYS